ncbi:Phage-related protein tail component [uncultured Mediterranean phage uvMED]|nr:Phage-related protein tail component [uncultured Mediterranean phage uvMED]
MKVVKVYGALRKRLGQCRFEFDVGTPAQAIKALCVNFPGLDKWLIDSEQDGVGYRVAVSKEKATEENFAPLLMPFSDHEVFSITPVVTGAGRGTGQILAGIALIAAAVVIAPAAGAGAGFLGLGQASAATASAFAASASIAVGNIGIALTLGGIATAISPQPQPTSIEESVQLESFTFSNVVNTSRQGMALPIAYGRVFVGSAVLSSGLDVDQVQA